MDEFTKISTVNGDRDDGNAIAGGPVADKAIGRVRVSPSVEYVQSMILFICRVLIVRCRSFGHF
jgi:hypothetical protein